MEPLKLLITDNTLFLSEKGKTLLEKTFTSDEECVSLLHAELSDRKKTPLRCLFSGSRIVTESRTIDYAHPEPFAADDKTLRMMTETAAHEFLEEFKDKDLEIMQAEVVAITLNGYPVKKLDKQKVTDLKATIFFSGIPSAYKKLLKSGLGRSGDRAEFSTFAWYQTAHVEALTKKTDFIACSVYEHSTDLAIRKGGRFFEMATLAIGTHHAEEHLAKGLPIEDFQHMLDKQIEAALAKLCDGISLPSQVYLLVAPAYQAAFESAFKSDSYHAVCFSEKGFEVASMSSILTA